MLRCAKSDRETKLSKRYIVVIFRFKSFIKNLFNKKSDEDKKIADEEKKHAEDLKLLEDDFRRKDKFSYFYLVDEKDKVPIRSIFWDNYKEKQAFYYNDALVAYSNIFMW